MVLRILQASTSLGRERQQASRRESNTGQGGDMPQPEDRKVLVVEVLVVLVLMVVVVLVVL